MAQKKFDVRMTMGPTDWKMKQDETAGEQIMVGSIDPTLLLRASADNSAESLEKIGSLSIE